MNGKLLGQDSAHISVAISDLELYHKNPETEKYTSTLANNIAGQIELETRFQQAFKGKTAYHQFHHSSIIVNGLQAAYLDIDSEDVLGLKSEFDFYNSQQNEEDKIDTFEETFGLFKIFALTHDKGHSFAVNKEISKLMEQTEIPLEDFLDKLNKLKVDGKILEFSEYLTAFEISNEKGAEERSKEIAAFEMRLALAQHKVATKGAGIGSYDLDYELTYRKYVKFINDLIDRSVYIPNNSGKQIWEPQIGFFDRVFPYIGKSEKDKVSLIRALCREKITEKIESKLSVLMALNFPWLEFHNLYPNAESKERILTYFAIAGTKLNLDLSKGLGRFYSKEDFPDIDVNTAISWEELDAFFQRPDIINIVNSFDKINKDKQNE